MKTRDLRNVFMASAALRHVLTVDSEGEEGGAGGAPAPDAPSGAEGEAETPEPVAGEGAEGGAEGGEEPSPPKPQRVPWHSRRIDALTAQSKAEKERADRLEQELAQARERAAAYEALYGRNDDAPAAPSPAPTLGSAKTYTEEEVLARAQEIARVQSLNQRLENLYEEGAKKHGDSWQKQVTQAGQAFGKDLGQRIDFFEALSKLPNGVDVYHSLTADLDHMSDVLSMNPLDLGMELASMSTKLASKPKAPAVSKAPAPIEPIDGQGSGSSDDLTKMPMEDYVKARERQREERFKARGY